MGCITIKAKGSKLREAILEHYKGDVNKTDIIFNDIILGDNLGDESFDSYLDSKSDFMKYESTDEPVLAEFIEWSEYLEHQNKINKRFSTNSFDTTTKEFLELSEGFTVQLLSTLFDVKGFTPNDLFEEGALLKINERNTMNSTLNQVKKDILEYADSPRNRRIVEELTKYPENFYKAYKNYLKTTFQVNLEVDSMLSDAIENKDNKETRDSAFNKTASEFDQKGTAPNAIKIMIAGLPAIDSNGEVELNDMGLIPAVDFDKTFNLIQQSLVELPGDIALMIDKLSQKASAMPALNTLIKQLNFGKSKYTPSTKKEAYAKEQLLRSQFVNQFNKSKLEFSLHVKNEDGTISVINSNLDKIENTILSEWENNLKEIISNNPNALQDINKKKGGKKADFLKALGIKMSNYNSVPTTVIQAIKDYGIEDNAALKSLYSPTKEEGVRSQLRKIATIVAEAGDSTIDFQHVNAEGKVVYGITLNTYLSSLAKDLRYYAGTEQLAILYPEIFEADYNANSEWLYKIKNGLKINVGVFEGFKAISKQSNNKSSKDLKAKDLNVQRIIGMLIEGKYSFIRSADRGTENYFNFDGLNKRKGLIVDSVGNMKTFLADHLEDEIAAIANQNANIVNYDKNNQDFRAFYIDVNGGKKSLMEVFNPKITSIKNKLEKNNTVALREELSAELNKGFEKIQAEGKDIRYNSKVMEFIDTMIDQITEKEKTQLEDNGVLEMQVNSKGVMAHKHISEAVKLYKNIDNVISLFALNSFASVIEQTKVFAGDLAMYKTPADIFKRMSMLNSTKESARTDSELNNHLNSLDHLFSNRSVNDSTIRTITIEDEMSKITDFAGEFDVMLRDVFGKDYARYAKVYNDVNEADGFAYMTYDEYRIASNRFGEWLPSDEDLYQAIARGDSSLVSEVMRRATVKKYQYTGKIVGPTDVNAIAVRKFAIMPLIPGAIPKGSILESLNQNMLDNNIGMAFYASAAKVGYQTFENENGKIGAHTLYDSNGNFHLDSSLGVDVLDYKYMGNQLKIHNAAKEDITASTQKRKLVESNFYKNGVLVDEGLRDLLDTYGKLQSKIVQDKYTKMIEENTVDSLIRQGLQQGYTTNELKSLQFLKELPIVDALPNKQRLESLIMARLSNSVISNKRKGDSLAQVPDVGFEVNDGSSEIANRHNLQFYRKDKKGRMLPMEIMIALPTKLIDYVSINYGDGTLTQDALDAFNNAIAEANTLFEETGEYGELDRLTTYVGYRVPNQAASSSDVAKVKKFMPPYMGAAVVVPKQIVAKTGSDFDIDKLNLYAPDYGVIYVNEKSIQKEFMRDNVSIALASKQLSDMGVTPESDSASDINKAFIENVIVSNSELGKRVGRLRLIYKMMLLDKGIPDSINYKDNDNNSLLETEIAITLHKANEKQLLAPLTDGVIQEIVKTIRKLRGESETKTDHISDVFTNAKNIEKFISFLSGKGGVGQVAIHIPNHVLAQKAGLKMKSLHNYFGFEGEIELGLIENESGQNISEMLSELLTAYVDIAKDDYILDINAVQSTANTILMMLRWGMKPKTIFLFINQPIIRDYVKAQSLNESVITDSENGKLTKKELVNQTMKKYGSVPAYEKTLWYSEQEIADGDTKMVRLGKIYKDITPLELSNNIKNNNKSNQIQMLDIFLETQRQSTIFQKMISSTSPDTKGFKGISVLENQIKEAEEVRETEMFVNYDKMFESFIGDYQDVKEKYYDEVKEHFISQNPLYKTELDKLKDLFLSKTFGSQAKDKVLSLIDNEFVRFILGRGGKINFQKGFDNLFTGKNSVPKTLQKLKNHFEKEGIDNLFLEQILPLINNTEQGFDNVKFKSKRLTGVQKETFSVAFKELKQYDEWIADEFNVPSFYQSLIAFQMIQTGIGQSPLSIMEAIPAEDYFNFMQEEIIKFSNSDIGIKEFTGASASEIGEFLLHHPHLMYKKYKLPFKVEWNNAKEKFSIKMYGEKSSESFSLLQMGNRHHYAQYGMYPQILSASKAAVSKYTAVKEIANASNYKYQLADSKVSEIRPELEKTLVELLNSVGADVQYVDQILDRNGEEINAYGRADLVSQVIQVTKDRNMDTLPEEAAHIITGMLGKNHPLMKQMMSQIDQFPIYQSVLSEYANVYETEEDFRFEAVGKMIATNLINGVKFDTAENSNIAENWFQRVLRKLAQMFFGKDTSKLQSEMDIFARVANKIITGQIKQDIADATETNVDKRTRRVAKMFKMNDAGIMPNSVNQKNIEASLIKEKLPRISVKKVKEGYTLQKDGKKTNPIKEYYQMRETTSQQSLVDAFVRDDKRKSNGTVKDEQGRDRYVVDGVMVPERVSDASSEKFGSNKSKSEIEKIQNKPLNRIKSDFGTYIHDKAEELFNNAIDSNLPQYSNLARAGGTTARTPNANPTVEYADGRIEPLVKMTQAQTNVVASSIDYLAQHINKTQQKINSSKNAIVRLENFVVTKDNMNAGTQDVTVVYSDGSVSIYDYKSISYGRNAQNSIESDTTVSSFKLDGFTTQISTYMKFLREEYGVTKFRDTRILPFAVQYGKNRNGNAVPQLSNIEGFNDEGNEQYLMPIPVVKELGENETLNKILTSLFEKETSLEKEIISNWGNVAKRDIISGELKTLKKSIKAIQVKSDLDPLIEAVSESITNISQLTTDTVYSTENIGELNKSIKEVRLFNSFMNQVQDELKTDKAKRDFIKVRSNLARAEVVLADKLNQVLVQRFSSEINTPQKELGALSELFNNFSQINQPIFEAGRELVKKATGDTNRDILKFVDSVEVEVNALKEWSKGRGISLMDAYAKLTNSEKGSQFEGHLIGEFSNEFYLKKKESLQEKDIKWLQENFKLTKEGAELYKQDLAEFESSLKKGSKLNKNRTKQWIERNDLAGSQLAWVNRYALNRYSEVKNEEKHYSKEYQNLLTPGNAGLKKYYDFYIQANRDFNEVLGGSDNIGNQFVANIRKDLVDSVAQGDGIYASGKNAAQNFLGSLRVRQNDVQLVQGEETTIPLLYKDNFKYKDKDGKWVVDAAAKNKDLTNNLILFSESVYRKKNMLQIADVIESLKMLINEQDIIRTTGTNKVILNEDGTVKTGKSTKNADLFDVLTKGLVYGKRIQNKDSQYGLFGQQLSTNKTITTAMSYMSTKSLAFNYVSGFGNAAAGMINTRIKSKSGLYYNSKQMNKSFAMITKRENRDIWNHAANFFNVEKDHWVHEKAAKLSASGLTKNLTFDKWYILQQKGDEMIANTILLSMMQNYGINENGDVKRLAQLPEGSKSILDRMDRSGDKISVEGMSNEAFDDFRNRVKYVSRQIKGTNTTEDLSKVQTDVRMKALTHFRNWIAPMVKERFGDIGYTKEVQEFEYGRFRGTFSTIMSDGLKSIPKILLDIVSLGKIKYKGDTETLTKQYNKFKDANPHLAGTKNMPSIEEYLEMRERALREGLYELKWITGLMLLGLAASMDWDDDGEPDYKKNAATRIAYKLMKRAHLELSFFVDPTSVKELLKSPIPVMQVLEDIQNLGGNTVTETGELFFGESKKRDQTPKGHYSKKMAPVIKVMFDLLEDLDLQSDEE